MSQFSFWWTTSGSPTGDQVASYSQAHLATIAKILANSSRQNGICTNYGNTMDGSVQGVNTFRIISGAAMVDGKPYETTGNEDITIPSASGGGNTRIDRIVLRADWSAFTVRLTRIAGTDAASPTAPAISTTSGSIYDLLMYQVTVDVSGNLTFVDEREFNHPFIDGTTITEVDGVLELADNAVTESKIQNNAVTEDKIINGAVTSGKIAAGAVDIFAIGTNAVTSLALNVNSVAEDKIQDGAVTVNKIAAGAVSSVKLASNAVTEAKISSGAVTAGKIASDSIDDSKIEHRVAKVPLRRGGSSSDWGSPGTTSYAPTDVKILCGCHEVNMTSTGGELHQITFPESFSQPPLVFFTNEHTLNQEAIPCVLRSTGTGSFYIYFYPAVNGRQIYVNWMAIGQG